jgi:hypothetical protein
MSRVVTKEFDNVDLIGDEKSSHESGTRRARPKAEGVDSEEREADSQRPTFRIPASVELAGYLDAPLRIDSAPVDLSAADNGTLRDLVAMLDPAPPPDVSRFFQNGEGGVSDARPTQRSALRPSPPDPDSQPAGDDPWGVPRGRVRTLRVRLTPYAREHAVADGETDNTPAAMLEYLKLLGSFERTPYVAVSMHAVMLEKLDHREGFVLSLVDGLSNIDTLLDACPMSMHKTLRILHGLCERGILGLR